MNIVARRGESHVVVEQIDHHALALDALGDEIDAGARQQIGEIFRMAAV